MITLLTSLALAQGFPFPTVVADAGYFGSVTVGGTMAFQGISADAGFFVNVVADAGTFSTVSADAGLFNVLVGDAGYVTTLGTNGATVGPGGLYLNGGNTMTVDGGTGFAGTTAFQFKQALGDAGFSFIGNVNQNAGNASVLQIQNSGTGQNAGHILSLEDYESTVVADFDYNGNLQAAHIGPGYQNITQPTLTNALAAAGVLAPDAGKATFISGTDTTGYIVVAFDGGATLTASTGLIENVVFSQPMPDSGYTVNCFPTRSSLIPSEGTANLCDRLTWVCDSSTAGSSTGFILDLVGNSFNNNAGVSPVITWDAGSAPTQCAVGYQVINW